MLRPDADIPAWDTKPCTRCRKYKPALDGKRWIGRHCPDCVRVARRSLRHTERAREYGAPSDQFTPEIKEKLLIVQDLRCPRCERTFSEELEPTLDHIVPLSWGGSNLEKNWQLLCNSCNSSKGPGGGNMSSKSRAELQDIIKYSWAAQQDDNSPQAVELDIIGWERARTERDNLERDENQETD